MRIVFLAGFICLFFTAKSQYLIGIDAGPDFGKSSSQKITTDGSLSFIYNPKYFCAKAGFGINGSDDFGKISRQFVYLGISTNAQIEDFFVARFMLGYVNTLPLDRKVSFDGTKELQKNNSGFSISTALMYRIQKYRSLIGLNVSFYQIGIRYLNKSHGDTSFAQWKIPFSLSYNYEF